LEVAAPPRRQCRRGAALASWGAGIPGATARADTARSHEAMSLPSRILPKIVRHVWAAARRSANV
jgi:hypothetical protein